MPTYTVAPSPVSPTYSQTTMPGSALFDDPNVIFDDLVTQFDGDTTVYTQAAAPTTPTYTQAAAPS